MKLLDNSVGNYRFLTGLASYSSGAMALPGYEIVHARLRQPVPYRDGFEGIDQHLATLNRPRSALCGIELRLPEPVSFSAFAEFNAEYQDVLADWNLLVDGQNPVARTNVAPEIRPPSEPALYGFSYTDAIDEANAPPTFVVAGAGELLEDELSDAAIIRVGDVSPDALQEKAAHVMRTMRTRLDGLQVRWSDATTVDVYTVHPLSPFLTETLLTPLESAAVHGLHWYYSRPPVVDIEFEMDLRGVRREIWLE